VVCPAAYSRRRRFEAAPSHPGLYTHRHHRCGMHAEGEHPAASRASHPAPAGLLRGCSVGSILRRVAIQGEVGPLLRHVRCEPGCCAPNVPWSKGMVTLDWARRYPLQTVIHTQADAVRAGGQCASTAVRAASNGPSSKARRALRLVHVGWDLQRGMHKPRDGVIERCLQQWYLALGHVWVAHLVLGVDGLHMRLV
jgi:hypothetical protein